MKTVIFGFRADFSLPNEKWMQLKEQFKNDYQFYPLNDCPQEMLEQAEVFVGWPDSKTLRQMHGLCWLQLPSAGANHFANNPEISSDVVITNATGVYNTAGAEHILALMLALTRRIPEYARQTAKHQWRCLDVPRQIEGSTVTIVGLGNIGKATAIRLAAFGAQVLGVKRTKSACPPYVHEIFTVDAISEAVSQSDFVVNVLPLTEETKNFFDRKFFSQCKKGAVFINAGRGQSVVQDDLIVALQSGQLSGAGLDVTVPEPLPADHPLWDCENVLITSHSLGLSPEKAEKQLSLLADNLQRFKEGQHLQNIVNRKLGY